jgi:hypothetical protein
MGAIGCWAAGLLHAGCPGWSSEQCSSVFHSCFSLFVCSAATSEEHQLAYEQFRSVSVWRKGMGVRVRLTQLLDALPPK